MLLEFERAWSNLNNRLRAVECDTGLPAAVDALEHQQRESGFLGDHLQSLVRRALRDPADPTRWLGVQYNPRRALRFRGSGVAAAPKPSLIQNDGCLLCRDNIAWQQRGVQLGYQVEAGSGSYVALMNPFPLLPSHLVFAAKDHRSQEWGFAPEGGAEIADIIADLVDIGDRLPGYLGFYNGVDAGASIPGHMHYQFVRRPSDVGLFPLESAPRVVDPDSDGAARICDYPMDAVAWRGPGERITAQATGWIDGWAERNRQRLVGLCCNLIVSRHPGELDMTLYFVPRDRARSRPDGLSGRVGGLEVLGEIVLLDDQEKALLDAGEVDYHALHRALASVRAPLESA